MIFKEIRPCSTRGALEVIPSEPVELAMELVETVLQNNRFSVVNAGILVVATRDDVAETTLYEDGRMLVKTLDPRLAHTAASRVYEAGTGNIEDSEFDEYVAAGRVKAKPVR